MRFSQEEKDLNKKSYGLGLGLSIAKENVELLGGEISLESEKGKGSVFFVSIPYRPVHNLTEEQSLTESQSGTILIVEDEEVNLLFFDTLLDDYDSDLKVLHAKNGNEAIDICKQNNEIDLVLMDLKMEGTNGFEATKEIKKFNPKLPVVAQTAYTSKNDIEEAMNAGCDNFISKPVNEETLYGIVDRYLRKDK